MHGQSLHAVRVSSMHNGRRWLRDFAAGFFVVKVMISAVQFDGSVCGVALAGLCVAVVWMWVWKQDVGAGLKSRGCKLLCFRLTVGC